MIADINKLKELILKAVSYNVSDFHLKGDSALYVRVNTILHKFTTKDRQDIIVPSDTVKLFVETYSGQSLEGKKSLDFSFSLENIRFRANAFLQRGKWCCVLRVIKTKVPTIHELNLPPIISKIARVPRGMVLVTGITGSGKSTTLASMINEINLNDKKVIITIENPIEYVYTDINSLIYQREIGTDTESFHQALKDALREDPDVILIGEMRDRETMEIALSAAETGHLVFATLHTLDAKETITRIIQEFPIEQRDIIRYMLATTLVAVISQRLIKRKDGRGMVPAVEIMINTELTRKLILQDRINELDEAIKRTSTTHGSQTFNQSLIKLLKRDLITKEDAIRNSKDPEDFKKLLMGINSSV